MTEFEKEIAEDVLQATRFLNARLLQAYRAGLHVEFHRDYTSEGNAAFRVKVSLSKDEVIAETPLAQPPLPIRKEKPWQHKKR